MEAAFAALHELQVGGLVIGPDAFLNTRIEQLAALAVHRGGPTCTPGLRVCHKPRFHARSG